jgi:hypothetical protein
MPDMPGLLDYLWASNGAVQPAGGLRLLSLLQSQLDTLISSEEETREVRQPSFQAAACLPLP